MIKHDLKHEKVIYEHFKIKFKTQNTENHDMKKWIHVYSNIVKKITFPRSYGEDKRVSSTK